MDDFFWKAPLFPPDVRYLGPNKLVVPFANSTESRRHVYQDSMRGGKDKYKFCKNCRAYVTGALYHEIPPRVLKLDCRVNGNVDIEVKLLDAHGNRNGKTTVMIRDASNHERLMCKIRLMGSVLLGKGVGNARSGSGDKGKMFGVGGRKLENGKLVNYVVTSSVAHYLPDISAESAQFAKSHFSSVLKSIRAAERSSGVDPPDVMAGCKGVSCSGDISIDLGNASHFDRRDASVGFSVWTKLSKDKVGNWFFILPNMRGIHNGRTFEGIAIALYNGAAISWDGRLVRHCTALPSLSNGQHVFGMFFAAKKKFH